jgi:choline transport protein
VLLISISGSFALLATASRMLWAFAREDGVPGAAYLARVETRSALPLWATGATALISLALALVNLGSPLAFSALTGLTVAGFYSSFLVAAGVMLHKRLTTPPAAMFWGSFRLGRAGVPVTLLAMLYTALGWLFSFWPQTLPVTRANFNWSLVVYFGFLLVALVFWMFRARKTYTGPKVEMEQR